MAGMEEAAAAAAVGDSSGRLPTCPPTHDCTASSLHRQLGRCCRHIIDGGLLESGTIDLLRLCHGLLSLRCTTEGGTVSMKRPLLT